MNELDGDTELIEEFAVESREGLDAVDEALLALETTPDDVALVGEIFRRVHSIKGASGFLGFKTVEGLSHAGESLLVKVRDGELAFSEEIATALMSTVDGLRAMFSNLETTGSEGPDGYETLIEELSALREGKPGFNRRADDSSGPEAEETTETAEHGQAGEQSEPATETSTENEPAAENDDDDDDSFMLEPLPAPEVGLEPDTPAQAPEVGVKVEVEVEGLQAEDAEATSPASAGPEAGGTGAGDPKETKPSTGRLIGRILIEAKCVTENQLNEALALQKAGDERRVGDILADLGYTSHAEIEAAITQTISQLSKAKADQPAAKTPTESSIRVDIDLLDGIVGLVGELVLTRNQIVQAADDDTANMGRRTQELAYITSALQEQALRTRMQRIENAWRSLPRVVRDVANVAGKKARLETSGEAIELDRTIIESVRDPLVHLVRNAVDHGLESPDKRIAAGKPETGTVRLSAVQDGGHVIIEVADDGAGIDPEKIAAGALAKQMVTKEQLAGMTPNEKMQLILMPGLSTAAEVTKISGRGVGMDVAAANIREIRGSIEISSELGVGTSVRLAIPLTLAIVPALVVTCAEEIFAVPQANVLELVRLKGTDLVDRIEWVHSAPVLRLRELLLPLIELTDILDMPSNDNRDSATIIVVQSGDQPFGLIVDMVTKAEEIVVKPVSYEVQNVGVYAGATVMGDGSAALILDVTAIARQSNLPTSTLSSGDAATGSIEEPEWLLTVSVGDRRAGLPTAELERLEKIHPSEVEFSGSNAVVQYRGRLLPLVFLSEVLDRQPPQLSDKPLRVVVTSEQAEVSVGLVVDRVLDVVEIDRATADRIGGTNREGVIGSIVADEILTELIDVPAIISRVDTGPVDLAGQAL